MKLSNLIQILISGVSAGVPYFLAASGLSLLFGVMRILNFAQGAYLMVGAYMVTTVLGRERPSLAGYLAAVVVSAVACAALAVGTERVAFRRTYTYGRDALPALLISFGLMLALTGGAPLVWGISSRVQLAPSELSGRSTWFGARIAHFDIFAICLGALITVGMYVLLRHTRWGKLVEAVSHDRRMSSALGISTAAISMSTFAVAGALAGIAGAVIAPSAAIGQELSLSFQMFAFVAVVTGGLGSIPGAFLGAMILGLTQSFMANYFPSATVYALYIVAAVFLLVRPHGMFAGPEVSRAG